MSHASEVLHRLDLHSNFLSVVAIILQTTKKKESRGSVLAFNKKARKAVILFDMIEELLVLEGDRIRR